MPQPQIDRASTNLSLRTLRSRNFSNRDNSFATARNLGIFSSSPTQLRFRGSIGRSDRKDVLTFRLVPGFTASTSFGQLTVQGGSLTYSVYGSFAGEPIQRTLRQRLAPGTYNLPSSSVPVVPFPITGYIVFDRPTANVRYSYRETYLP